MDAFFLIPDFLLSPLVRKLYPHPVPSGTRSVFSVFVYLFLTTDGSYFTLWRLSFSLWRYSTLFSVRCLNLFYKDCKHTHVYIHTLHEYVYVYLFTHAYVYLRPNNRSEILLEDRQLFFFLVLVVGVSVHLFLLLVNQVSFLLRLPSPSRVSLRTK